MAKTLEAARRASRPQFSKGAFAAAAWVLCLALTSCGGEEGDEPATEAANETAPTHANSPPSINGTPTIAVTEGDEYVFQPSASDPNGDPLSFSIENKPGWASFDTTSGRLAGTPDAADVGLYAGIRITATDGESSRSLPIFSVEVLANGAAIGTATLSWMPPTERTDGGPLGQLAGYKVHYGNAPREYTTTIVIDNPGITTYVVDSLASGTWYFAATALDTGGLESAFSNEVSKSVP